MARRVSCCLATSLAGSAAGAVSTVSTVSEADSELTLPRHEVPGADDQRDHGAYGADEELRQLRGVGGSLGKGMVAVADQHRVPGVDDRRERVPLVDPEDPVRKRGLAGHRVRDG